jgi:alkylated DNA repair dioxygenase AlkB
MSEIDGATDDVARRIALSDGSELLYVPGFLAASADELFRELVESTPWDSNVEGAFARPRRTYWIGDFAYRYSGVLHHPAPWTPAIAKVRAAVEGLAFGTSAGQFRGVLLNHYRSGRDSIGFHADNEPEIEPLSPIASISLGAERTFILKPRKQQLAPGTPELRIVLAHGSCLVMFGRTQLDWRHGIPAEPHIEGGRVNLTFRKYTTPATASG